MAVYLVTYDLNKEKVRPPIVEKIREFSCARLSESSYAINTDLSADQVFEIFQEFVDKGDFLYVIALSAPCRGFGNEDVNAWMKNNIHPY